MVVASKKLKHLHNPNISTWLLRLGLVFVFLYAGIESLMHPVEWASFLPAFLTRHFNADVLIKMFAVYELVLAAGLLYKKILKPVAALCALTLIGIVATAPGNLIISFRDVGLAFMAIALIFVD